VKALAAALVAIVVILTGAALYVFHSAGELPRDLAASGVEAIRAVGDLARAFRQGTVTTSFVGYATQVTATKRLQVATLAETEVFERRDEMTILWGQFALPDVVIEARAPIEYTYYVDLDKPWAFALDGPFVTVKAPSLEWNAPALDVSRLTFTVREGSILRDEEAVIESLRLALTELCRRRAAERVALAREPARRSIESFVDTWLHERFDDGKDYRARVVFGDEPPEARTH
jgi:hypothetical protein